MSPSKKLNYELKNASNSGLLWALFVAVGYFFIVRKHLLTDSLDMEEMLTWQWVTSTWGVLWKSLMEDLNGPVYFLCLKTINIVWPLTNDFWVRLFSLTLGAITIGIWSQYWYSKYRNHQIIVATLTLLLGLNSLFQYVSTYTRGYILSFTLISFLTIRFANQISKNNEGFRAKIIQITFWEVLAAGLIINTHHLGALWLASVAITTMVYKLKFNFGASKQERICKLAAVFFGATYVFFFIVQLPNHNQILWTKQFAQDPFQLLAQVFSFGSYLWIILLVTVLISLKHKTTNNIKFWLFQVTTLAALFTLGGALESNFFVFRYLIFFVSSVLILQEEVLRWLIEPKHFSKTIYLWLPLAVFGLNQGNLMPTFPERHGPKQIFSELRSEKSIQENTPTACYVDYVPYEKIIVNYSIAYFNRDLCTTYVRSVEDVELKDFKYLLVLNSKDTAKSKSFVDPDGWSLIKNSSSIWLLYENKRFKD